jgi:phage gp46-like protein
MSILLSVTDAFQWDAVVENGAIQQDEGLFTAVALSFFTDAPATADDLAEAGLPADTPSGYWGHAYPVVEGDVEGSKLWLLKRRYWDDRTIELGEQYAAEALEWMEEDGLARDIEVTGSKLSTDQLLLVVAITKADGSRWTSRWAYSLGGGAAGIEV